MGKCFYYRPCRVKQFDNALQKDTDTSYELQPNNTLIVVQCKESVGQCNLQDYRERKCKNSWTEEKKIVHKRVPEQNILRYSYS